jgi:myosin heavy subunit
LVKHTPGQDDRESCMILFEALGIPAIERQFGSTKLFLKSGMVRTRINIITQ